jgi:hypothetical protein
MHPFDFSTEDLAEIKALFPEFKPRRTENRQSGKINGLDIVELKKKIKEKVHF